MSRGRLAALAAVLSLLAAALLLRSHFSGRPANATVGGAAATLAPLRARAELQPCPAGVGALPDLVLPCLGGGPPVRLSSAGTGVPTLVTVYGSWCGPCQQETPVLVAFAARAGSRVRLLGVDTEDEPAQALQFAIDFRAHWPSVVDDQGKVLRRFGSGPPVTLLVDGAGRVAYVHRGQLHSVADIQALVRQHLGVRV